jgi:hypothetical protein
MSVITYLDAGFPEKSLAPTTDARLIFRAFIDKHPGCQETVDWHFGRSGCWNWNVLWLSTDLDHESVKMPVACLPAEPKNEVDPWLALLRGYWEAEKRFNEWEGPNYSEIAATKSAILKPAQINALAAEIWPRD